MSGRLITAAAVVLAIAALVWVLFLSGGSSYQVTLTLDNASQLVKGNQVKVGGVAVGSVDSIELGHDAQARMTLAIDDERHAAAQRVAGGGAVGVPVRRGEPLRVAHARAGEHR